MNIDDFPTCREIKCVCFDCQMEKRKPSGCRLCPGRLENPKCNMSHKSTIENPLENTPAKK